MVPQVYGTVDAHSFCIPKKVTSLRVASFAFVVKHATRNSKLVTKESY